MPKYYCDYCDIYLTHDSPSVRKSHNEGWKHKAAVKAWYSQFIQDATQDFINERIKEYESRGDYRPPGMPPGSLPPGMPPGMPPHGMPPGMPPHGPPPGWPPGMPPPGMPPGMPPPGMPPHGMPPGMPPHGMPPPGWPPGMPPPGMPGMPPGMPPPGGAGAISPSHGEYGQSEYGHNYNHNPAESSYPQ